MYFMLQVVRYTTHIPFIHICILMIFFLSNKSLHSVYMLLPFSNYIELNNNNKYIFTINVICECNTVAIDIINTGSSK